MCRIIARLLLGFSAQAYTPHPFHTDMLDHLKTGLQAYEELIQTGSSDSQNFTDKLVSKLVDKVFNRALRLSALHSEELENTMLAKPGHLPLSHTTNVKPLSALSYPQALRSGSPWSRPRYEGPVQAAAQDRRSVWAEARPSLVSSGGDQQMQETRRGSAGPLTLHNSAVRNASKVAMSATTMLWAGASQAAGDQVDFDGSKLQEFATQNGGNILQGLQQATEPIMTTLQGFTDNAIVQQLGLTFANTLIAWAVPVGVGVTAIGALSRKQDGMAQAPPNPFAFLNKKPNAVKETLKIERLNEELESYSYTFTKAMRSEKQAALEKQRAAFARIYSAEIAPHLNQGQINKIVEANQKFQKTVGQLRTKSEQITCQLRALAAKSAGNVEKGGMMMVGGNKEEANLQQTQVDIAKQYSAAEMQYIRAVSAQLPNSGLREEFTKLLKNSKIGLTTSETPFLTLEKAPLSKPHVWCLQFNGNTQASQVESLRREVTAIIREANATRNDEVVLRLTSPGGTVTGYGRAAAQLTRFKEAGLKLTICVEEVAASGGYMMACVADHLVASPMAVLGSIGVITELPNAYDRLQKEGLKFLTVTAGEYKRTLTPFKKPTKQDEDKLKEDIGMVWNEFKSFVADQRPVLDVDKYGTGETWFGREALKRNLCDEIANADDVILNKLDGGAEIYKVSYKPPSRIQQLGLATADAQPSGFSAVCNVVGRLLLGESLADIVQPSQRYMPNQKYMAFDQTAMNTRCMDEQYEEQ